MATSQTFTLRRVAEGLSHVARVQVALGVETDAVRVVDMVTHNQARPRIGAWVDAAIRGVRSAASLCLPPREIHLMRVEGEFADTTPNAVWCAAAVATWRLLNPGSPDPQLAYECRKWHMTFPDGRQLSDEESKNWWF